MTIQEFIDKYLKLGQIEVAGSVNAKYQCVDLANAYFRDVLKLPIIEWTNAKDFPLKVNLNDFEIIKNTPDFIPKLGDVAIWSGLVGGGAGHIAIVRNNESIKNVFYTIDQNWSKPLHITLETHNYKNVLYFLRPKQIINHEPSSESIDMSDSILLTYLGVNNLVEAKTNLTQHLGSMDDKCDWGNDSGNRGGHLGAARREIKQLQEEVKRLQDQVIKLKDQISSQNETVPDSNDNNLKDVIELPRKIDTLEIDSVSYKVK